jgi:hypothetical protein
MNNAGLLLGTYLNSTVGAELSPAIAPAAFILPRICFVLMEAFHSRRIHGFLVLEESDSTFSLTIEFICRQHPN